MGETAVAAKGFSIFGVDLTVRLLIFPELESKRIGRHPRFPIGIAIMFFDENIDRRKSIMIDLNF